MALAAADFDTCVYSRDSNDSPKATITRAIGATYVSADEFTPAKLAERLGNIDVVYEAAGASSASFELLKHLGTNGVFVFTGVPGRKAPVEVDTDLIMRNLVLKNQVVYGTVNAGTEAFDDAIRDLGVFVQRWPDTVRSLITGRFPMEAHRDLLLGPPSGIKNVIAIG
jgi:threonine dehydrogenase-like Zn-dependent dehydrogenase